MASLRALVENDLDVKAVRMKRDGASIGLLSDAACDGDQAMAAFLIEQGCDPWPPTARGDCRSSPWCWSRTAAPTCAPPSSNTWPSAARVSLRVKWGLAIYPRALLSCLTALTNAHVDRDSTTDDGKPLTFLKINIVIEDAVHALLVPNVTVRALVLEFK